MHHVVAANDQMVYLRISASKAALLPCHREDVCDGTEVAFQLGLVLTNHVVDALHIQRMAPIP